MPSLGKSVEQLEHLHIAGGRVNLRSNLTVPVKQKINVPSDLAVPLLVDTLWLSASYLHQETGTRIVKAPPFVKAKNWKQPKCSSTVEWITAFPLLISYSWENE